MKKNYSKPTIKAVVIQNCALLSGSDVNVYKTSADQNEEVLSKGTGSKWKNIWSDDEE